MIKPKMNYLVLISVLLLQVSCIEKKNLRIYIYTISVCVCVCVCVMCEHEGEINETDEYAVKINRRKI